MRLYVRVLAVLLLIVAATALAIWQAAELRTNSGAASELDWRDATVLGAGAAAVFAAFVALVVTQSIARPLKRLCAMLRELFSEGKSDRKLAAVNLDDFDAIGRIAAQARNHETLYRAAVQGCEDAILTQNRHGFVTSVNPAAEQLYGYRAAEIVGRHINIIVPAERHGELRWILERLHAGDRVENVETVHITRNNERKHVSLTLSPVKSATGDLIGASAIARDISKRVAAERRLQELQTAIAHATRLSTAEELAAALAHELNQPLASVCNYLSAAMHRMGRGGLDEIKLVNEHINKASDEAKRAAQILRRLRDFSQRRQTYDAEENLNDVVEGAMALATIYLASVNVIKDYSSDLPPVTVDAIQIQQVILNLVRNAAEAMVDCSQRDLEVRTFRDGNMAVVTISDTGIGLPDNIERKLFRPFTSTKAHGMGIGLSISRSIIEAHEGTLAAARRPERGTTFSIQLPIPTQERRHVA